MSKPKLHEIIAVSGDAEASAAQIIAETKTTFEKKPSHFMGSVSKHVTFNEGDPVEADVVVAMVTTVGAKLDHTAKAFARALDVEATLNEGNTQARADVVVDGQILIPNLPTSTLLYMEKNLKRLISVFSAIPTLAPGRRWERDEYAGKGMYVDTVPVEKFRTQKVPKTKVVVPATEHHPAQTQSWTEDEKIGKTVKTEWSGLLSRAEKAELIARTQRLLGAVKAARQRANCHEAEQIEISGPAMAYILEGLV